MKVEQVTACKSTCFRCGADFSNTKKNSFPNSYAELYHGVGHLHICRDCLLEIYGRYLVGANGNQAAAVRQVCRKLDLYWNQDIFDAVSKRVASNNLIIQYSNELNKPRNAGKSYDDTLIEEDRLWDFLDSGDEVVDEPEEIVHDVPLVDDDTLLYWGGEYDDATCRQLDNRKAFYIKQYPSAFGGELDVGTDTLLRQVCILDVSNAKDVAAGKNPSQGISTLNNLLSSLAVKPDQKKASPLDSMEKIPLGMLAKIIEEKRPIKHDENLNNPLIKYITVWYYGHMCKSMGINNTYSRMYEEEMAKYRVENPDIDEDDDNEFLAEALKEVGDIDERV